MDLTWSGHDRTCAKCEQCVDGKWSQHGQDVDRLRKGLAWIITRVAVVRHTERTQMGRDMDRNGPEVDERSSGRGQDIDWMWKGDGSTCAG